MTQEQARNILAERLHRDEASVNGRVRVQLTQYQFDALVSFNFNAGSGNLRIANFVNNDINQGNCDPEQIASDWRHFRQNRNRQNDEIRLFNYGIYR